MVYYGKVCSCHNWYPAVPIISQNFFLGSVECLWTSIELSHTNREQYESKLDIEDHVAESQEQKVKLKFRSTGKFLLPAR